MRPRFDFTDSTTVTIPQTTAMLGNSPAFIPSLTGLAHEDRLIIRACLAAMCERVDSDPNGTLREALDWHYIVRTSIQHGVAPLLFRGLVLKRSGGPEIPIPPAVAHDLQELYRCSEARNQRIFEASAKVFDQFASRGIDALVLKEFSLVYGTYAEPALRPMGDADILIPREQYAAARECLEELGFDPLLGADKLTLKYALGHGFRRERDNFWIDLQWDILQREWSLTPGLQRFDIGQMWAAARPMSFMGTAVWKPCPEHNLYHLCLHLEGHRYAELILLVDIAELVTQYAEEMDWDLFLGLVRRTNTGCTVHRVLSLAARLLQAPIPISVLEQCESPIALIPGSLEPIFRPLSRLHFQLDQARIAAAPPPEVMDRMEATVRRHAAAATELARELETLAGTILGSGGSVFLLRCAPSERLFADTALNAFGRVTALVLESDLPQVLAALERQQYRRPNAADGFWHKAVPRVCPDPVIAANYQLELEITTAQDADLIFLEPVASGISVRAAVAKALWGRVRSSFSKPGVECMRVRIRIVSLPLENMVAYIIAELGRQTRDRMFGIANALDFLRRCKGVQWKRVAACAHRYGLDEHFRCGLRLLAAFTVVPPPFETMGDPAAEHLLLSARYDISITDTHSALKRAFFCLWTLLSVRGAKGKLRYAAQLARRAIGGAAVLPKVVRGRSGGVWTLFRRREPSVFTCWVEPHKLKELTTIRPQQ